MECDLRLAYVENIEDMICSNHLPIKVPKNKNSFLKSNHKEGAEKMPEIQSQDIQIKKCSACNEKPPITPKHSLCSSCMAKRSKSAPKAPRKASGQEKETSIRVRPRVEEKAPDFEDKVVKIDFSGYPGILEKLVAHSRDELRPLDLQIMYILKRNIESFEGTIAG